MSNPSHLPDPGSRAIRRILAIADNIERFGKLFLTAPRDTEAWAQAAVSIYSVVNLDLKGEIARFRGSVRERWSTSDPPDRPMYLGLIHLSDEASRLATTMIHHRRGTLPPSQLRAADRVPTFDDCQSALERFSEAVGLLRQLERESPIPLHVGPGPLLAEERISEDLELYYIDVFKLEAELRCRQRSREGGWVVDQSVWLGPDALEQLRGIDERHGIRPDDPRVYSIAAYLEEKRRIEAEWERSCQERRAIRRADPNADPPYGEDWYRYRERLTDCETRHFPGLFPNPGPSRIDTRRKLWEYIQFQLSVAGVRQQHYHFGPSELESLNNQKVREVYSLLHTLSVRWTPSPPYRDFSTQEAIDELTRIANRLEQEDAEGSIKQGAEDVATRSETGGRWDPDAIARWEVESIIEHGRTTDGMYVGPAFADWVRRHRRLPDRTDTDQGDFRNWYVTLITRRDYWARKASGSPGPMNVDEFLIAELGKSLNEVEAMTIAEKTDLLQSTAQGKANRSGESTPLPPGQLATEGMAPSPEDDSRFISLAAAAKFTGHSKSYLSKLCSNGSLRTNGIRGRGRRIDAASLAEFMERQPD